MTTRKSKFHIFRLTFRSLLDGLNGQVSDGEKQLAAQQLFESIGEKMTFLDGNQTPVETDPANRFGRSIVYTRISREKLETLNDRGTTHRENKVNDYPYFNVVFDFRHPTDYILVAIERNQRAFSNILTVSQGLEQYFRQQAPSVEVNLRAASLSRQFWHTVEQKCLIHSTPLKGVMVEISDVDNEFPFDVSDEERLFLSTLMHMTRGAGASDAHFGFGAGEEGKCLEVSQVSESMMRVWQLAGRSGFVIRARLGNGMEVSSAVDAPAVYPMDKRIVGDGGEKPGEEKMPLAEQEQKLKDWFDKIYSELKGIEEEERNDGKTRRHIKK